MKRRGKGALFVGAGAVLLLSALLLFLHNTREDVLAGQRSGAALSDIRAAITEQAREREAAAETDALTPGTVAAVPRRGSASPAAKTEGLAQPNAAAPPPGGTVTVGEIEYIGILSIPALGVELPVMAEGDFERLKTAPCRQFGTPGTNDLVIAGHNFDSHFGRIDSLRPGDTVTFTDAQGDVYTYSVVRGQLLNSNQVAEVQNSGYPLGLYTCAYDGRYRFIVFCSLV